MRYTGEFLAEALGQLQNLGLKACETCGSEAPNFDNRPVVQIVGGTDQARDEQTNAIYLLRIECPVCGRSTTYSSERYGAHEAKVLRRP